MPAAKNESVARHSARFCVLHDIWSYDLSSMNAIGSEIPVDSQQLIFLLPKV